MKATQDTSHCVLPCLAGADMTIINAKGQEPIHLAVMRNHVDIVKYMFEKSVNLESQCFQGKQPLHYAAQHGGKKYTY